jgi:rare lipoprotein A
MSRAAGPPGEPCARGWAAAASLASLLLLLPGCGTQPELPDPAESPPPVRPLKDGTPAFRPDLASIPDAVPRFEPITAAGNKSPYTVLGETYRVTPVPYGYRQRGIGSWYGTKFHGQFTSNGEPYDVYAMTAAHKTLPIPCYVRVTNLENGRSAIVRVNDRGPFHDDRIIDLSYAAAYKLGYADTGTAPVEVELLDPGAPPRAGSVVARGDAQSGEPVSARRTYLQAGAFRSLEGARTLQRHVAAVVDHEVFISETGADDDAWYRVRVGPLDDPQTLFETQRRINAASLGTPRVVTE